MWVNTFEHMWVNTFEHLPVIPKGKSYVTVLAYDPSWEEVGTVEFYYDGPMAPSWVTIGGAGLEPPAVWAYMPEKPIIEKPHHYTLIRHSAKQSVVHDYKWDISYSLIDLTNATHEIPDGEFSFTASSLKEANLKVQNYLDELELYVGR